MVAITTPPPSAAIQVSQIGAATIHHDQSITPRSLATGRPGTTRQKRKNRYLLRRIGGFPSFMAADYNSVNGVRSKEDHGLVHALLSCVCRPVAIYGEGRQPATPDWIQEWLNTVNLALAHTMMLSSYVEECANLS